jgi:hypothetical protein
MSAPSPVTDPKEATLTQRSQSTEIPMRAPDRQARDQVATTFRFIARDWQDGLPSLFNNDLNELIRILAQSTWHSWRDWARAQHNQTQDPACTPPKLAIKSTNAPAWQQADSWKTRYVVAFAIHAGDFELPIYQIEGATLEACQHALHLARQSNN